MQPKQKQIYQIYSTLYLTKVNKVDMYCFLQVVFASSKAAKACALKLDQTSKMGNIMNVFVDQLGKYLDISVDCNFVDYICKLLVIW